MEFSKKLIIFSYTILFILPRSLLRCGGQKLLGHHRMRVDCRVRRRDCVLPVEIEERKQGQIRPAFPHEIRR